jgi:hypothetical protein
MDLPASARRKAPYGLSFPVQDLLLLRGWAEPRGLRMEILLDQVMDGAEFEELLLVRCPGRGRRALSIWRTSAGVIAQASGGQPLLFSGVQPVAAHFNNHFKPASPPHRTSFWRQLLLRG